MADHTDEEWDEIGRRWRDAAGMQDALRFDAQAFVRWLKHNAYLADYICLPDGDLPNAEGKYDPEAKIVYYRDSIWRAAGRHVAHAVWTLVHEPCHLILRHSEVRFRMDSWKQNRHSRDTGKDESDANRLAASILAPYDQAGFTPSMSVDDICQRFGLSRQAATRRREEFARMFRRSHNIPRALPPGVVDFLSMQRRKGFRVTSLSDDTPLPRQSPRLYDGDACPCCGAFTLVRSGLARICEQCGSRLGDD